MIARPSAVAHLPVGGDPFKGGAGVMVGEKSQAVLRLSQDVKSEGGDNVGRRHQLIGAAVEQERRGADTQQAVGARARFGRDGVPFYLSGPYDNPRSVVRTLARTCGEGNYHYVVGVG